MSSANTGSALRPLERAQQFAARHGIAIPILQGPMASASPVSLASAVANAGGMGGMGALTTKPEGILAWAQEFRAASNGAFQLNLWVPDPPPLRDAAKEAAIRHFLSQWGPEVPPEAGDARPPDFASQCEALLAAGPRAVSSIMGIYPPAFVADLKARGIAWFATVTTLKEALIAQNAGADAVIA